MRVEWLPEAVRNLAAQLDWIAERDTLAAISIGEAVDTAVARLANHPWMGRRGRIVGTRELPVVGTPYIVIYRVEPASVVVLRVLHGAQRWPPA